VAASTAAPMCAEVWRECRDRAASAAGGGGWAGRADLRGGPAGQIYAQLYDRIGTDALD